MPISTRQFEIIQDKKEAKNRLNRKPIVDLMCEWIDKGLKEGYLNFFFNTFKKEYKVDGNLSAHAEDIRVIYEPLGWKVSVDQTCISFLIQKSVRNDVYPMPSGINKFWKAYKEWSVGASKREK